MKGLILKDLMCLRKQLTNFCFVMAGVLIASIMYVLSARFGNMAKVGQEMLNGNATQVDVRNIGSMVLVMFMLLPIASVGDMLFWRMAKPASARCPRLFRYRLRNGCWRVF